MSLPTTYESLGILHDEGPFLPPLPDVYATHILQFLPPYEVLRLRQVSPSWNRECCSSCLWQYFSVTSFKNNTNILTRAPELVERILDNGGRWMDVWRVFMRVDDGWNRSNFKVVNVLDRQDDLITRMVAGDDYIIVNSQLKPQLSLYTARPNSPQGDTTFTDSDGVIVALAISGTRVIAGTQTGSIHVYNLHNGTITASHLHAHKSGISSIIVHGGMIFTAGFDGSIHIWSLHKNSDGKQQQQHTKPQKRKKWVQGLKKIVQRKLSQVAPGESTSDIVDGLALSPSKHKLAFKLKRPSRLKNNPPTTQGVQRDTYVLELVKTMSPTEEDVYCIMGVGSFVATGGSSGIIKVWQISSGCCIKQLGGHDDAITTLAASHPYAYSGSMDATIREWNLSSGECTRIFQHHHGWIKSISIVESWLVSGGQDEILKVWHLPSSTTEPTHLINLNAGPIVSISASFEHILVATTKNRHEGKVIMLDVAGPCLANEPIAVNKSSKPPAIGSFESFFSENDDQDEEELWLDADEHLEDEVYSC
ncbi:hypothetical protein SeMB42_g02278 [Synchytrium endobioticum]|uniref:F-box domain-containing protein n=1 Tax=Synchytrium endobioticum TaxID=286115 RepID=A0A507DFB2_9FUNG|nr:hypothetical protein SeLEV6574_g05341 [Synchytrium endobioticum]TPX50379.1 hypothetical protein SeMB42_g02278 [Synchytrium endobioticum]